MRELKLERSMTWMGKDLVLCIQNEHGHIGSVVTGEPYEKDGVLHVTTSSWNRLNHKDELMALLYVKGIVPIGNCVVTCCCGIHLDDITPEELKAILAWGEQDLRQLKQELIHHLHHPS